MARGLCIVVFPFACLLAGRAILPASAAKIGTSAFADAISTQELKLSVSSTKLPNAFSRGRRFSAPKLCLFMDDPPGVFALVVFLAFGAASMYTDVCELAEDEERQDVVNDREVTKARSGSFRTGKRNSRKRVVLCIMVAAMVVLASLPVRTRLSMPDFDVVALDEINGVRSAALQLFVSGRTNITSLHGSIASDRVVAMVLAVASMIGSLMSYLDLWEIEAEEKLAAEASKKRARAEKSQAKPPTVIAHESKATANSPSPADSVALPLVLTTAIHAAAVGNIGLCTWALSRLWVQVGTEAVSVPGFARMSSPVASDETTLVSIGVFTLLGLATMCIDFRSFASEEERKPSAGKAALRSAHKKGGAVSWSQYFTVQWRLVSCAVLLLSVIVSAVASLN